MSIAASTAPIRRLGDITRVRTGKLDANAQRPGGPYPFFTCGEETLEIDHYAFDTEAVLLAGNGNFNVKWYRGKFNVYQRTYVIEPVGVHGKWLFYAVQAALRRITSGNRGSVIRFIRLGDIVDSTVSVPSEDEQRRIVAEIEKQFTRLEAGVAALRRVQANLHRYRAAVLKAAIPATGTPQVRLEELAEKGVPVLYGILQPGPGVPDGIPYVRPTEIDQDSILLEQIRRTSPAIAAKYKRSVLKAGDIILSIVGTIGKVAIVPASLEGGNITQSSVRIRPDRTQVGEKYLAWVLRSPFAIKQYDAARLGTAVPRLNVAHVRDLLIPVPPVAEQERIVAEVERRLSVVEELSALVTANLQRATRLRQSILQQAFEGKLI